MVASTAPKGASAAKSEVWSKKNACVVCTEVCKTEEEKKVHEGKQTHIKKMSIHTFLGKEAAKIASSDLPSTLLRRFSTTKERAIGLDCMHEIRFPWSSHGWWVCSICYDSGCTFEQAEQHVRSVRHLSTYLDEFDPDKAAKVDEFRRDAVEHYEQLICARNEIYKEQGEMLLPPEILELTLTKEVAMAKLVVGTVPTPGRVVYSILKDEDTTKRAIIKCTTCFEVIPCFKKNLTKVWIVHENTPGHRRCSAITGILNQLPCEEVIEADVVIDEGPYNWRHQNGVYFGPVCGITYLLTCGSENYCTLCFCKVKSIEQHFSSEHHIFRFITMKKTPEMFAVFQHNGVQRRSRMAELLMETPLDTESHRKLPSNFLPSLLLFMPPVGNFGFDGQCLICEDCCLVIKVPQEKDSATHSVGIWNDHVGTSAHFDFMARRSSFRFYDEFFVPLVSSVSLPKPSLQGEWRDIEVDDNTSYRIQTQCDVGLEWIVEDQENGEVVCTLCARTYKKDSKDAIKNHVRSYMHLNQYLHMTNRELLAIVMMQNSEKAVLDLIMQWLQTNSKVSQSIMYDPTFMQPTVLRENWSQIRVYSPDKANRIAKKHRVPTRMVSLPYCDPTLRPLIACLAPVIDAVAQDGVEKETVDLREALCVSSIRIIHMDDQDNLQSRRWLLRCMACQMVFSTTVEKLVHDVWEDHMHSADHDRRIHNYETCNLDMCGFAEASSTYTVKPFVQADPNKKVTWQWNAKSKVHDFVLCVIGLEDLVERKSNFTDGAHNPDFFCRLCAEVIPRRAALLEEHVRSGRHVMSYVQKYNPMTFFQVDSFKSDEGGKLLRRTVAQLLKDVKPPSEYCIPVYDPIGEQERKGQLAVAQAKEADRLRSIEESRKKAQEARVARDEERRKLLAIELEKEKKRRAERDRREAEAKARVALMEAEKERIKQMAEAERSRLRRIAEEKMKEKTAREKEEKEKKESARRQRERNDLKAQLEQKKAKLKDQEKQLKLVMEKKELEKRHSELLQKAAAMQKQKNSVPEPKLMIAPQLSSQPVPQMSMMNMPPPMLTKAMTMDFSMPPPIYGSFELGAKPNFSTYVPTAEAMPVYPMDGDMMDVDSRSSSRSSSRSRSTSRDRRRSRDRKRSRSRSRSRSRRKSRRSHSRSRNRRTGDKVRNVSKSPSPVPISPPTDDQQKTLTPKREKEGERKSLQGRTIDPQVADERTIKNRADLVDFLWRHGAEKIPSDELPDTFTKKAAEVEGNVGIDNVYEVVCLDSSDLDTFYCSICGMWTTPSEMLKHIATSEHKLAFMYRNNKQSHGEIMSETNSAIRRTMLDQFALKTWKEDQKNPKTVCNRLRAVLNRATICRVWPEHIHLLDHSWKMDGLGIPAPVSKDVYSGAFSIPPPNFSVPPPKPVPAPPGFAVLPPSMTPIGYPPPVTTQTVAAKTSSTKKSSSGSSDKDKRKRSPTPRSSRKRSSSRDRHRSPRRRSRSPRRRSRSPPKKKRSRSRSRDRTRRRSRSRDRSRRSPDRSRRSSSRTRTSRSSKDDVKKKAILSKDDLSWVDTAAAFLEKLGDVNGAQQIRTQPVASQAVVKPQPVVTSSAPSLIPSIGTSTPQQLPTTRIQPQQMLYRAPPPLTTLPPVRIGFSQPMQHQNPPPQQQPECIVLDDDAPSTVRDEKAEMRKLLGVLITMQQEAERNGGLDPATVDRLYQEVGLKKTEGLNSDQLLAQLLTQLASNVPAEKKTVDLSAFGISASAGPSAPLRPPVHQPPPSFYPQQQQYTPAPSLAPIQPQQQKPTDPQLQKLLQGIGDSLKAMPRSQAEPIYKPNPYTITRTEDFYGDSGMSYVYPDRAEEQPQPVPVPAPVATEQPDPKKEKAALRKKMLLEQAERLRKQAEASSDAEDDDWDNLESEMTQMLDSAPVATTTAAATTPLDRSSPSLRQAKMGVPTTWMQPVPQPKPPSLTPSVAVAPQPEVVPIAPGQKMPLARTMLPNGKLPPGVQQQQPRQETPPTSTAETPASSVPQPTLAQFQQQPGFSGAYPQQQPAQGYMQPMYGGYPQQQYGQMYGQPQQYPYMQQQGYGMQQQYMQPAPPGAAYPQQQTTQQQQQYYAQYGQQQPQQQYKY